MCIRDSGYRLLYLTLDGKEACDDSSQGCPYQCISYKNEISKWLAECARIYKKNNKSSVPPLLIPSQHLEKIKKFPS